ncbi:MAG: DUF4935 domain-containing protein [Rhodobacteraceae bacterium]|nr:DUF4935 domain-containing protein [Paracoccaceae bacterium]
MKNAFYESRLHPALGGGKMRDRFSWYFFSKDDYDAAWDIGILTVDTNVILDLYRYNKSTREALLLALESFKGRFWISHQTAKEFIKNRRVVITDMRNDFERATKPIDDLEKALMTTVGTIRGCRVIPRELSEALEKDVRAASEALRAGIDKESKEVPDFEDADEIVQRLESALDGHIGTEPDSISDDLKEAERRKEQKIPPGYLDDSKDGLGFAGDYLMWKQILAHSKAQNAPIILVTSETKEDWWEKKSGKTLNPRLELLQEAFDETGRKILIYHTDQFLRLHQERIGKKADDAVFEEIREYSLAREPAVSVSQEVDTADNGSNNGRLRISVLRPVRNFTGTGRFKPGLSSSPEVSARLVESPDGAPSARVRSNTGTTYDFNVHVHSNEHDKALPVGEYLLEYEASCGPQSITSADADGTE